MMGDSYQLIRQLEDEDCNKKTHQYVGVINKNIAMLTLIHIIAGLTVGVAVRTATYCLQLSCSYFPMVLLVYIHKTWDLMENQNVDNQD